MAEESKTAFKDLAPEVRRKYFLGFQETMVKIWRERINMLGVIENPRRHSREGEPHLYERLVFLPVLANEQCTEVTLSQEFLEYGLYQDFGVGGEKWRGNPGDYLAPNPNRHIKGMSHSGQKERERRRWFSVAYYRSVMNLKEFLSENYGNEFIGMISDIFERTSKA